MWKTSCEECDSTNAWGEKIMTKYGTRDNKIKAEIVTADSIVPTSIDLSNTSTVSTAATGTAAYIPVVIDGVTYYIEGKQ